MTNTFTGLLTLLILCCSGSSDLWSQQLWPGDINDNGEVGVTDLLYFGHAYGATGPDRPGGNGFLNWNSRPMGDPWDQQFPDSTNFAYADVDGNGAVNERDLEYLAAFLGRHHDEVSEDMLLPTVSVEGVPTLRIAPSGIRASSLGDMLVADVSLTNGESVVSDFYGLAMRIDLPEGLFRDERTATAVDTTHWIRRPGERVYGVGTLDSNTLEVSVSRIDHQNVSGSGRIFRLFIPLKEGTTLTDLDALVLTISSAVMVDKDFNMKSLSILSDEVTTATNCPLTATPVCGIDGVTYLNGCFAEAAGVTFYTAGACYSPGIDVGRMDSVGACPTVYDPVCGFNYVTYANACVAEKAGLVAFSSGQCGPNDFTCYDPSLIVLSSGTEVNTLTGVIELTCPGSGDPVLGCDGLLYPNACTAEASGVKSYTLIGEEEDCIDTDHAGGDDDCEDEVEFVCGCNDVTYLNACYADAAGVTSFTEGPCGGSSNICDEAISLSCGEYRPNETTIGAGNQRTEYPGCVGVSMIGPDRVYVFQKTTVGDLQIGLEIMTPDLDLDVFLMRGECGNLECVGASTTSNTVTNNEGIVLNDAPLGTYYIIVDQQKAGVGGNFRLEVSCGYLDCSDTEPLDCGVPYHGSNVDGGDNVSTYTCGSRLNVENNGPEVIHSFMVSEEGSVTIDLTGLSANLELFLLSSCSRRECLAYSQKPGTQNEQIVRNLSPGTYYVAVDGYNGAVSDYTLTVNCNQDCELVYEDKGSEPADCGQNNGIHNFSVYGGSPSYIATYHGPVSGSTVSSTGHFCLVDLVPGDYVLKIEDAAGCDYSTTFTIEDKGGLELWLNPRDASCGTEGAIGVSLGGGEAPYTVYLSGEESGTFETSSTSFSINNLRAGHYTVTVVGANGCSATKSAEVEQDGDQLLATATPYPAGCGQLGRIRVVTQNGTLNFVVKLTGPVSGSAIVKGRIFTIHDLPAGAYVLKITDANGCTYQESLIVPSIDLEVQLLSTAASCGQTGSTEVNLSGGTPPYHIAYSGPASGTVTSDDNSVTIDDLPSGSYTYTITDDNGCSVTRSTFVEDNGGNLELSFYQGAADCGAASVPVFLTVSGGHPNYSLTYSGPENGTASINATGQIALDLPPGNYTFSVKDFNGCSVNRSATVTSPQNNLSLSAEASSNACGEPENITAVVAGGTAPYTVMVTNVCGLEDSTFNLINNHFVLEGLPNCVYTLSIEDANGCTVEKVIAIDAPEDNMLLTLTPVGGSCAGNGYIDLVVNGGDDPYYIMWTGPVNGFVNLVSPTYRVENLPAGDYTFNITTNDGCTEEQTVTLNNGGDLELNSSLITMVCGQYDQIWNDILGGTAPYTVEVIRLCDGLQEIMVIDNDGFELIDLIPCDYKIKVTDANGCMVMNTIEVFPYELFDAIPTPGLCGRPGEIKISITNSLAQPTYQVTYSGPRNGSFSLNANMTTLVDLPAGNYTITITDANGCSETEVVVLEDNPSDLELLTAVISNDCGQYNQLWNDINGGVGPYTVRVTRLCDNVVDTTFVTSEIAFEILDLDSCCYEVKITDALGCMDVETRCVDPEGADIFTATPVNGPCGELGRIELNFTGGSSPYQISYFGPQSGMTTLFGNSLTLTDLPAGTYTIMATDDNGCEQTETVTIEVAGNDLELVSSLILNDCGQYNQVWNDIIGGTGPYAIEVIRLCDSTEYADFVVEDPLFELFDLPPCKYKIIVVDALGCMTMDTVMIFPSPTDLFTLEGMNGECNELGSFTVNFIAGTPPYTLRYSGPLSDSIVLDSMPYTVGNLPSGTYTVIVTDAMDCVETDQVTISNTTTDLELVTAVIANSCGQYNQLWHDVTGGVAPYTVEVIRLCDNTLDTTFVTSEIFFESFDLDPCIYKVKVTDAEGCMAMTTSTINSTNANLFELTTNTSCTEAAIRLDFIDGTAPYEVTLMSPDGEVNYPEVNDDNLVIPFPTPGDYMVIVNSAEGCTEFDFFSFAPSGGPAPTANFDFSTSGNTLSFVNLSSPGGYLWDFGDEAGSTEKDPMHTYDDPGTYEVCLRVTNGCGVTTSCRNVTISTGSINLDIGEVHGRAGTVVSVPVTLSGATNIATLAGSFRLNPVGAAVLVGVTPELIDPHFNPDNATFSFLADNSAGVTLDPTTENLLFNLRVEILMDEGQVDIFFSDQPIALEFSGVVDGLPTVQNTNRGSGMIMIDAVAEVDLVAEVEDLNGAPINNAGVMIQSLEGGESQIFRSDANGIAALGNMPQGNRYRLSVDKEDESGNGLSTFGLFVGQRYLLGMEVPQITSPYQVIAGDINCSNSFSTLDLFIIQRIIIGDQDGMPGCPDWVFVHEGQQMPTDWNVQNVFPLVTEAEVEMETDTVIRFTGVKKGDILGAANPANFQESRAEGREATLLTLSGDLPRASAGQVLELKVASKDLSGLASLQFELVFPADKLEFLDGEGLNGFNNALLSDRLSERGKIRLSWFDPTGTGLDQAGEELLTLRFRARTDIGDWSEIFALSEESNFVAEAYHVRQGFQRPVLAVSTLEERLGEFTLLPNNPNPFREITVVNFILPTEETVELSIFDALGRRVVQRQQRYVAGPQRMTLDLGHLEAGVYYYRVRAGEFSGTRSMVIQR